MNSITFEQAIDLAKDLKSEGDNPEYDRALAEFIAYSFSIPYVESDERIAQVETLIEKTS